MKIGLLFGSFNPIHIGHTAIANYMAEFTDLDEVWLVVSPHNPLKNKKDLADANKRFARVKKAIGKSKKIKVSSVEFKLPQPSYTVHTLEALKKKFPKKKFMLIIGEDNLRSFHQWKDYRKILSDNKIYVYPRRVSASASGKMLKHQNIKHIDAPRIDISSTFIREAMKKGKDVRFFVA